MEERLDDSKKEGRERDVGEDDRRGSRRRGREKKILHGQVPE
jgi:hypothetical protein